MNLGRTAESADVALLLEGTYPFVSGGVSSWVQQIIKSFPDIRYAVYFVGSMKKDYGKQRYPFPDNVVHAEAQGELNYALDYVSTQENTIITVE